ncbi:hypothetical protein CAP36_00640 [Chitinophagaceae bacterium IBVUCB2]|nr:hypothetical protein CAP36_00640 [Chitinophagaceae bacterium IBVUCB2]
MKLNPKLFITITALLTISFAGAQTKKGITEYLTVPGPIILNKNTFHLAWTSHPSANYYKQEYITAKDSIQKYTKMVSVELLISDATAANLAKAKMDELKQLKLTNPLINYEIFQKNGEIILDFLISENAGDKVNIIERNVYRYKAFSGKNGQKGVMLFGASERAYGNSVDAFLSSLKKNKSQLLNAVAAFTLPTITIKP